MKVCAVFLGLLLAAAALMWPAIYNGQPIFFPDTADYMNAADAGIHKVLGLRSAWTSPEEEQDTSAVQNQGKAVRSGRSIYYGVLLYAGEKTGGFWLTTFLQSVLLLFSLHLIARASGLRLWSHLAVVVVAVAIFSPAALFASFLMPDVFAGVSILTCASLIAGSTRLNRTELWLAALTLTFALSVHFTHVLLALVATMLGLIGYRFAPSTVKLRGVLLVGASICLALLAGAAFDLAVKRFMGEAPVTPPFVSARIIEDGPGYRYLRDTCPGNGLLVCHFLDRLPLTSDDFLWNHDPSHGVFGAADPESRRLLSAEQWRFAWATFTHAPLDALSSTGLDVLRQLYLIGASDFRYNDTEKREFAAEIPTDLWKRMQRTPAYTGAMPVRVFSWSSYIFALGSFIYVMFWMLASRSAKLSDESVSLYWLLVIALGTVIANAVICGGISSPQDRYQARVIWIVPALGAVAVLRKLTVRTRSSIMTRAWRVEPVGDIDAQTETGPIIS
jgi:hypothetical protein